MGRSTKRRYEEHTLAARGEGHPFPARGPLEPETKQMTNVGSRFRGLARKRGKLFSI